MKNYILDKMAIFLDWLFEVEEQDNMPSHAEEMAAARKHTDYWINVCYLLLEKTGEIELPSDSLEYNNKPAGAVTRITREDVTTLKGYKL